MRSLVDTHAFFWWVTGDSKLSILGREVLEESASEIVISAVVPWELATKGRLGKWPGATQVIDRLDMLITTNGLAALPISIVHARTGGLMRGEHRDPFDRLLAAQALVEDIPIVTADPAFRQFDVEVIW